ncbi:MAG TPA: SAM-dependent methyltransferase, partial [Steroidobacteraceae bacterium]|nr:SAM-dependent methyltransferase [Steroidobacteraceae bacterium]
MTGQGCGPLLTLREHERLLAGRERGSAVVECSLDLGRSTDLVKAGPDAWTWRGVQFPYLPTCRERAVYYWEDGQFRLAARFGRSLVKLVPTEWGAPTFEIDGIKMLPTDASSPYEDARRKIDLVRVRGRAVLDTCGGLGYYAAWCL